MNIFDDYGFAHILNISREFFYRLCHFCLYNNYMVCRDSIFLQTRGIGMGTNFSSSAADLFLFYYENRFTQNNHINLYCLRYIDDLIAFNCNFSEFHTDIYPDTLTLKRSNNDNTSANYLDLNLKIFNDTVYIDLYDKRNDFNFDILTMPHWNSNINKKVFSNVVIGQFLRYFKICSLRKNASKHCFLLIARLFYHRNYPINFLNYYDRTLKNSYIS